MKTLQWLAGRPVCKVQGRNSCWIVYEWCPGKHKCVYGWSDNIEAYTAPEDLFSTPNPALPPFQTSSSSLPSLSPSHLGLLAGIWTHQHVLTSGTLHLLFPWPSYLILQLFPHFLFFPIIYHYFINYPCKFILYILLCLPLLSQCLW